MSTSLNQAMANKAGFQLFNSSSDDNSLSRGSSSKSLKQSLSSPLNPDSSLLNKQDSSSSLSTDDKTIHSPIHKLRKTRPYGQLQDVSKSKLKLHRIYSENETSNFNHINGRRMYDDQRHRHHRTKFFEQSEYIPEGKSFSNFQLRTSVEVSNHKGLEDEYIPDFDFSNTIQQWTDSYYAGTEYNSSQNNSISSSVISRPFPPVGKLHAQVSPVSVPGHKKEPINIKTDPDTLTTDEEQLISKLPQNFTDLPFSVRRKLLADISPNDFESVSKIVKKKFRKRQMSSPAVQFLSSFSERSNKEVDNVILDHTLGGIIGYGAWGIIRECTSSNGESRAMKVVRVKNDTAREFFKRETTIWSQLHHDTILRLINVKETPSAIFCLTDRAYGGTLFDLVSKWGLFPSKTILAKDRLHLTQRYCLDILSALRYMHSIGIVHGDVKLENCLLLSKDVSSKVLLCDFGMSLRFRPLVDSDEVTLPGTSIRTKRRPSIPRSFSGNNLTSPKSLMKIFSERSDDNRGKTEASTSVGTDESSSLTRALTFTPKPFEYEFKQMTDPNLPHSHIGSLPYAAPELLESSPPPLGPSADTWAFGVLLYTMIVGKLPFQHSFEPRLRAMIASGKYDTDSLKEASQSHKNLYEAVTGCLTIDMNKRLNLDQVTALVEAVEVED